MAWSYRSAARMVRGAQPAVVRAAAPFRHNTTCAVHAAGFAVPNAAEVKVQPG